MLTELQKNILITLPLQDLRPLYAICKSDEAFISAINEVKNLNWDARTQKEALRGICYLARQGKYWSKEELPITPLMSAYEDLLTLTQVFDEHGAPYELWQDLFKKHIAAYENLIQLGAPEDFKSTGEFKNIAKEVGLRYQEFKEKGIINSDY